MGESRVFRDPARKDLIRQLNVPQVGPQRQLGDRLNAEPDRPLRGFLRLQTVGPGGPVRADQQVILRAARDAARSSGNRAVITSRSSAVEHQRTGNIVYGGRPEASTPRTP